MPRAPKPLLAFYGDDFTGSTDALEQLTLAGVRTALFITPPTPAQLARYQNLQAIGVAGTTRSLAPDAMARTIRPVLKQLKATGARHIHYKVCSTFDSSPTIGSIGRVMDEAARIFPAPFIPLLVAAPALGRHCVFGNLFARFGIGSQGAIHRLDRHPSISKHPITPMTESDLRLHLGKQTKKKITLFDILKIALPAKEAHLALKNLLSENPDIVLFDTLYTEHLLRVGELMDAYASPKQPLFSVGSSGVESALAAHWKAQGLVTKSSPSGKIARAKQILVVSGSCSPVTEAQLKWAISKGFGEVALDTAALADGKDIASVLEGTTEKAVKFLKAGRSVIVHTSKGANDTRLAATARAFTKNKLPKSASAAIFGDALGWISREAISQTGVNRLCIAGGDTSSYAALAMGIEALEMIAPLTPGAPFCRAHAPGSPADGIEVVFKGGQVGGEDYFQRVLGGM